MSDSKIQLRIRRLADTTKRPRERLQVLSSLKDEGFSQAEIAEIFNSFPGLFDLYKEYVSQLDEEMLSKGRQFTSSEVAAVASSLKGVIIYCPDFTRHAENRKKIELELLCYLHTENHISTRRVGIDLLLNYMVCVYKHTKAIDQSVISQLVSSLDWDFFRSPFGSSVVLPASITETRKTRHPFILSRSRSTTGFDEEREREALDGLRIIFDFVANCAGDMLSMWWKLLRDNLVPIFFPKESSYAGVIETEVWDGFCHSLPPKVHGCFIDFILAVARKPRETISLSEKDMKIALHILFSIGSKIRQENDFINVKKAWKELMGMFQSPPDFFLDVVEGVVTHYVSSNRSFELLGKGVGTDKPTVVAAYEITCNVLLMIAQHPKLSFGVCLEATKKLCLIAICVADHVQSKNTVAEQIVAFVSKAAWASIVVVAPPHSENFTASILPLFLQLDTVAASTQSTPYFLKIWLFLLLQSARHFLRICARDFTVDPFTWPSAPVIDSSCSEHRSTLSSINPTDFDDFFRKEITDNRSGFIVATEMLHNCMASLLMNALSIQRAKAIAMCEFVRILALASGSDQLFVDGNALLSLVCPYLIIAADLQDANSNSYFAPVAIDAVEVLAMIVAAPTAGISSELFAAAMNAILSSLNEKSKTNWEDLAQRVTVQLFRSNSSTALGIPTPNLISNRHEGAMLFMGVLYDTSSKILLISRAKDASLLQDAKVAAFTVKCWQLACCYQDGQSRTSICAHFITSIREAMQFKYPVAQLIRSLSYAISMEMCCTDPSWSYIEELCEILFGHWNALDPRTAPILSSSCLVLLDGLVPFLKKSISLQLRSKALQLYSTVITYFCSTILYHLSKWRTTRVAGPAILYLFEVVTMFCTRCGNLDRKSGMGIELIQLCCDVISFATVAKCHHTYVIGVSSAKAPFQIRLSTDELQKSDWELFVPGKTDDPNAQWTGDESQTGDDGLQVTDIQCAAWRLQCALESEVGESLPAEEKQVDPRELTFLFQHSHINRFGPAETSPDFVMKSTGASSFHSWIAAPCFNIQPLCLEVAQASKQSSTITEMQENMRLSQLFEIPSDEGSPRISQEVKNQSEWKSCLPPQQQANPQRNFGFASFLVGIGATGFGDVISKNRPLSSAMKPQNYAMIAECEKIGISPVQFSSIALVVPSFRNKDVQAVSDTFAAHFGRKINDTTYEHVSNSYVATLVQTQGIPSFGDAEFQICVASDYKEIRSITQSFPLSKHSAAARLFLLPGTDAQNVFLHVERRSEGAFRVAVLIDGCCVPIRVCCSLVRACIQESCISPQAIPAVERASKLRQIFATETPNFETFLLPLVQSNSTVA